MDKGCDIFTRPASKEVTERELVTMSAFIVLTPDVLARQLNIPNAVWSYIRQDNRDNARAMIIEILLKWLQSYTAPNPTFGDLHRLMSTGFELSSEYDEDNDTVTLKMPEEKRQSKKEEDVGHVQRTMSELLPHKKKRGSPEKDRFYPVSRHDDRKFEVEAHVVKRKTDDHHEENLPEKRAKRGSQTKLERRCSPRKPLAGKINQ